MEKGQTGMSFSWIEDSNEQIPVPMRVTRKVKHKKMEFVGWGSKPLMDFLESTGNDNSKQLSHYDAAAIVNEYVNRHNLLHPEKKKRIVCDEWLYSLFRKKTVLRNKIYELLEEHFAENHDSSEDDLFYSSDEQDEAVRSSSKKRKISYEMKQAPEVPKSCFAAIVPQNIKLLYLKRSLVQDFLKYTETFEGKVVGSYVRIKSDPNDYFQKLSHQLLPVTGVISEGGAGKEILLQVPNVIKAIPVRTLSEDNFSEEECEYLRQRVKDGLIKRPTVVEFEQKARFLHEDITNHWLERELSLLRNLMDRANEKGWRRECSTKYEYSERIQLLETPAEKTRLLNEVPKVIADELEPDSTLQEPIENANQGVSTSSTSIANKLELDPTLQAPINNAKERISSSPTSIVRGASFSSADSGANQPISSLSPDAEGSIVAAIPSQDTTNDFPVNSESKITSISGITSNKLLNGSIVAAIPSPDTTNDFPVNSESKITSISGITSHKLLNGMQAALEMYKQQKPMEVKPASVIQQQNGLSKTTTNKNSNKMQVAWPGGSNGTQKEEEKKVPEVIELSDDDEEEEKVEVKEATKDIGFQFKIPEHPHSIIWYYKDPQGDTQGPFPMTALKAWYEAGYFHPSFKVWKRGQTPDEAVSLSGLIREMFSN